MPDPFSANIKTCHACTRGFHQTKRAHANCPHSGLPIVAHATECDCPIDRFRAKYPRGMTPAEILPLIGNAPDDLPANWATRPNVQAAYRLACAAFIETIPPYPAGAYAGRGVVVCGGGKYFLMAVVAIKLLRRLGCNLPIELWGLPGELPAWQAEMVAPLGVACRRTDDPDVAGFPFVGGKNPGWELKTFAALHTSFAESLHLDADSFPQQDPTYFFGRPEYLATGAIFWPDLEGDPSKYGNDLTSEVWAAVGLPDRREPAFESGQFVVNREKWWRGLCLSNWFARHGHEFYYKLKVWYGDKECPHVAARMLGLEYAMPPFRPHGTHAPEHTGVPILLQRDFDGKIIFAHGTQRKWFTVERKPHSYFPALPMDDAAAGFFLESRQDYFARVPKPFICAVTIAVGYADYIEATKANRRHLDDWIIVTVPGDPVIELCEREGISYVADPDWLRKNGTVFNLGAGRNLGFAAAKAKHGHHANLWLLALDGDCRLDTDFRESFVDVDWSETSRLFGGFRYGDGSEAGDNDISGFFQLFSASWFPERSYLESKRDCGKSDINFRDLWKDRTVLRATKMEHLGTTWMDWCGRVSKPVGMTETNEQNGRRLWGVLHGRPAVCELDHELRFLEWFTDQIQCLECRENFRNRLRTHPPRLFDRESYARWTWETHEAVNADLGKPAFPWEAAVALYGWESSLYEAGIAVAGA